MGAPRGRKPLIKSRRRVDDDGEEEGDNVVAEEDSLSEGSIVSDGDDDADGEGSDNSETEPPQEHSVMVESQANGHNADTYISSDDHTSKNPPPPLPSTAGDTETMMNGLRISEDIESEEVHFGDLGRQGEAQMSAGDIVSQSNDPAGDKRRREHDNYRRRRDADPAFVPNRGGFFMHDHRSTAPGPNGYRPIGRGRGRERGGVGGAVPASK